VRIALDAAQLKANPLRVGLSMDVEVDVRQKGGKMLADAPRTTPASQTQVYSRLDQGADAEVQRIIAANLGRAPALAGTAKQPHGAAPAAGSAVSHVNPI
jgi:membrane fusion protein (multidrug efflux system)